jgi:polyphosphate kinase
VSIIGRFLEHSRLFRFGNGGEPERLIGSADWMPRNLDRRVEAVAPISDPGLCRQLDDLLDLYLSDTGAWHMQADGSFHQQQPEGDAQLVQQTLMDAWRGGLRLKEGTR